MRISDWGSDVCSSDLVGHARLLPSDQITVQLLWVKAYQSDSRGGARRRRATTCCHSRSSRGPKLTVGASSVASRSEERRVGKACDRTGRYRWSPTHSKTTPHI